jgi:hypothetical protein
MCLRISCRKWIGLATLVINLQDPACVHEFCREMCSWMSKMSIYGQRLRTRNAADQIDKRTWHLGDALTKIPSLVKRTLKITAASWRRPATCEIWLDIVVNELDIRWKYHSSKCDWLTIGMGLKNRVFGWGRKWGTFVTMKEVSFAIEST